MPAPAREFATALTMRDAREFATALTTRDFGADPLIAIPGFRSVATDEYCKQKDTETATNACMHVLYMDVQVCMHTCLHAYMRLILIQGAWGYGAFM